MIIFLGLLFLAFVALLISRTIQLGLSDSADTLPSIPSNTLVNHWHDTCRTMRH